MTTNTKRCASKDWPYEDERPMFLPRPGYYWECPDGTCECHPEEEGEPLQLSVLLCDELARPMPNARCRILHAGRILNEDTPNADAEGWLSVTVHRPLRTVTLEWAPPDTPLAPMLPFRWRYHVDLEEEASDKHAIARRLHNLGFSRHIAQEDNVKEFQRAFGYDEITGDPEDIREDLLQFHDEGGVPPLEGVESEEDFQEDETHRDILFAAFPVAGEQAKGKEKDRRPRKKKDAVPRRPPPQKHKPAGGKGKGTARPRGRGTLRLRVCSLFSTPPTAVATSCRWDKRDSHPVVGALVELFDRDLNFVPAFGSANPSPKTNGKGKLLLQVGNLPDGEYVLKLNPPEGHALRAARVGPIKEALDREMLLRPVGPNELFPKDPPKHTRFRFLEIRITLKKGVLVPSETKLSKDMRHDDAIVAHGSAVSESESSLIVDWKPDWVRCGFVDGPKMPQIVPNPSRVNGEPEERILSPMTFIILHHTATDTPGSAINGFLDSATTAKPKGAHYLVDIDGHVIKLANESMRALHPGKCYWYGLESEVSPRGFDWVDVSVGIEQVHVGTTDFANELVAGTKNLIQRIRAAHGTSHHNVLGHGEIAIHDLTIEKLKKLGRKLFCPGEQYNWTFLESSGNATRPVHGSRVFVPHDRYGGFFVTFPGESINTIEINSRTKAQNIQSILPLAIRGLKLTLSELGYFVSRSEHYDEPTIRAVEAFQVRYFSGGTRKDERKQIMQGSRRLANLVTVRRMHAVLAARGSFKF